MFLLFIRKEVHFFLIRKEVHFLRTYVRFLRNCAWLFFEMILLLTWLCLMLKFIFWELLSCIYYLAYTLYNGLLCDKLVYNLLLPNKRCKWCFLGCFVIGCFWLCWSFFLCGGDFSRVQIRNFDVCVSFCIITLTLFKFDVMTWVCSGKLCIFNPWITLKVSSSSFSF